MSGLDDFFAKKDRKKKKSSSRTTIAPPIETKPDEVVSEESPSKVPPPSKPVDADDGWIEIDDPRGSQVNTGGRTVVEFKRYVQCCGLNAPGSLFFPGLAQI